MYFQYSELKKQKNFSLLLVYQNSLFSSVRFKYFWQTSFIILSPERRIRDTFHEKVEKVIMNLI